MKGGSADIRAATVLHGAAARVIVIAWPAPSPPGCPVHADFDPLSPRYLQDPFAVLRELPVEEAPIFYAPAIDYYVVTRYEDIEAIFHDHETFSAGAAQLPLAALSEEAGEILLGGGHRPAPSMVSLDPPEHTRVRRHTARAFTPRRVAEMEPTIRATVERPARRGRSRRAVRPRRGADLPAAGDDRLHASSACRPRTTRSSSAGAATAPA